MKGEIKSGKFDKAGNLVGDEMTYDCSSYGENNLYALIDKKQLCKHQVAWIDEGSKPIPTLFGINADNPGIAVLMNSTYLEMYGEDDPSELFQTVEQIQERYPEEPLQVDAKDVGFCGISLKKKVYSRRDGRFLGILIWPQWNVRPTETDITVNATVLDNRGKHEGSKIEQHFDSIKQIEREADKKDSDYSGGQS